MQPEHMKPGAFYQVTHAKKGVFYAVYRGIEDEMLAMDIWTGPGSGQERLANAYVHLGDGRKTTPLFSAKLLAPVHVTDINAPTSGEQARLRESVDHSAERDYNFSGPGASVYEVPRRPSNTIVSTTAPAPPRPYRKLAIGGAVVGAAVAAAKILLGG